jgi:hypothetical protein
MHWFEKINFYQLIKTFVAVIIQLIKTFVAVIIQLIKTFVAVIIQSIKNFRSNDNPITKNFRSVVKRIYILHIKWMPALWVCAVDLDNTITQFRHIQIESPCCVREYILRMSHEFNIDSCAPCALQDSGTHLNIPNDLMITIDPLERPLVKSLKTQQEVSIECPILIYGINRSFTIPTVDEFMQAATKLNDGQFKLPVVNPLALTISPSFFDTEPPQEKNQIIQPPPVINIEQQQQNANQTMFTHNQPTTVQPQPIAVQPQHQTETKPDFSKLDLKFF